MIPVLFKNLGETAGVLADKLDTGIVSIHWKDDDESHIRFDSGMETQDASLDCVREAIKMTCRLLEQKAKDIKQVLVSFNMSEITSQLLFDQLEGERISDENKTRLIGTKFIPNFG